MNSSLRHLISELSQIHDFLEIEFKFQIHYPFLCLVYFIKWNTFKCVEKYIWKYLPQFCSKVIRKVNYYPESGLSAEKIDSKVCVSSTYKHCYFPLPRKARNVRQPLAIFQNETDPVPAAPRPRPPPGPSPGFEFLPLAWRGLPG